MTDDTVGAGGTFSPQPGGIPQSSVVRSVPALSSAENMLERKAPNTRANWSAATIEGVLYALSTAPT
jgi:hypothetical protein